MKTRSMVLEGPRKMVMREFDIPQIGPDEGLLKVVMTGVCGTDPKFYQAGFNAPLILGHEMFGHIAEIGQEASKRYGIEKGDHVVLDVNVRCGFCPSCLSGNYKFCSSPRAYGTGTNALVPPNLWGAYGEYMYIAPNSIVHKVSKDMASETAVLINAVIANGIQWIRIQGGASIQKRVVIQGVGPQGLAAVIAARESGASPIIVTGIMPDDEQRFALAKEFGADYMIDVRAEDVGKRVTEITEGKMADLVLDVTGNPQGILKSIDLVKQQGTVVCAGVVSSTKGSEDMSTPIPTNKLVRNEIRFQGVHTSSAEAVVAAVRLVESGKYPIEKMVTHRFSLERAEEAVKTVGREVPGVFPVKAVIVP